MVGWNRDHDRLLADFGGQLGFDKIADFAAAFADQPDDDDVAFGPGDHLPHQHRFADARSRDDCDALAFADGQQRVDRAHAHVERAGDAAAAQRIDLAPGERPLELRFDRRAAVERIALRVDDAAKQCLAARDHGAGAMRFDRRAGDERHIGVEGEDKAALTAKADNLAIDIIIVRRLDADIAAQRLRETRHFEHDTFMRDEGADAARAGIGQVDRIEQLLRGEGEAARHADAPSPSATHSSSR